MSFGGEVGDEECLVLDFGPEESNIGDFIEKINLNQREQCVFTGVKTVLDGEQGIELDDGQLLGIGEYFLEGSDGLIDPMPR